MQDMVSMCGAHHWLCMGPGYRRYVAIRSLENNRLHGYLPTSAHHSKLACTHPAYVPKRKGEIA